LFERAFNGELACQSSSSDQAASKQKLQQSLPQMALAGEDAPVRAKTTEAASSRQR